MTETGLILNRKDLGKKSGLMGRNSLESIKMESKVEEESFGGRTEVYMMGNLATTCSMEKGFMSGVTGEGMTGILLIIR